MSKVGMVTGGISPHGLAAAAALGEVAARTIIRPPVTNQISDVEAANEVYNHLLPDRLCIERDSPFFTNLGSHVGVRIDGQEVQNAVEYSVKEGWIREATPGADGKVNAEAARKATKRFGVVSVYWRMTPSRQVRRQLARVGK